MKKIIFLCTGNSCRSQMAEGFAKSFLKETSCLISSAGLVADGVNKMAIQVMAEVGIDISKQMSNSLDSVDVNDFELVVTVCDNAKDNCPFVLHNKLIHKHFDDPAAVRGTFEEKIVVFRQVRDQIEKMVKKIITNYDQVCLELN